MSIFNDNITNDLSTITKIRVAIEDVLDGVVDLVNNHFEQTKLNTVEYGNCVTLLPPNTTASFIRESNDALKELCSSEFGHRYGLLITKPISLKTLKATPMDQPDSWTEYEVKVMIEYFHEDDPDDDCTFVFGSDVELLYTKTIYNQPHWP